MRWTRDPFIISDERSSLILDDVHSLLQTSHWASDRSKEAIGLSVENSLNFGLFDGNRLIGFARMLTDYATYAVILDFIISEQYRGQGLGKWLMGVMTNHSKVNKIRQILWTSTAVGFYEQFDFQVIQDTSKTLVKPPFRWHKYQVLS